MCRCGPTTFAKYKNAKMPWGMAAQLTMHRILDLVEMRLHGSNERWRVSELPKRNITKYQSPASVASAIDYMADAIVTKAAQKAKEAIDAASSPRTNGVAAMQWNEWDNVVMIERVKLICLAPRNEGTHFHDLIQLAINCKQQAYGGQEPVLMLTTRQAQRVRGRTEQLQWIHATWQWMETHGVHITHDGDPEQPKRGRQAKV